MKRSSLFKLPFKIAYFELKNDSRFAFLFLINLAIGLAGFVMVDAFKASIQDQIEIKSKKVLGADVSIGARRMLTKGEKENAINALPSGTKTMEQMEMFSMAYNGQKSRLVNVIVLADNYPLIPALELKDSGLVSNQIRKTLDQNKMWTTPELLVQLGTNIGDKIQLGEVEFEVSDEVLEDPASSTGGFSLAPRVYISSQNLEATGLVKFGSRVRNQVLYLLPAENANSDQFAEVLHQKIDTKDIRIRTHKSASRELNRALILLGDNLSLIALIALFLAGIGASYLFKSHLQQQIKDMASLLTLGFSHKQLTALAIWKIILLSVVSGVVLSILTPLLLPLIPLILKDISKTELVLNLDLMTVGYALLVSILTSLLLCLPTIDLLRQIKPALLLKEGHHEERLGSNLLRNIALYVPCVLFFWALSCWQARSFIIGTAFSGGFTFAAIVLYMISNLLIKWSSRQLKRSSFPIKLSYLNLTQIPSSTIVAFLAISLSALLLNIIPHLESTVSSELKYPDNKPPPSLFLFDIQQDQLSGLKTLLEENGTPLINVSPLIRARLEKINGQSVEREDGIYKKQTTREREWENRLRNRTYNLSYREGLFDSETLVSGSPFSGVYDWDKEGENLAEVSLEYRFAERLGIKINDTMEFDIQGVSVVGKVVNTRKVKWTSFQPNFFVQFQPGVLDDAPKSFLAAISKVDFDTKISTQNLTVEKFPNLSIVDVEDTLERISSLMTSIIGAVKYITLLAILAGLAVIFSIMNHAARLRMSDYRLLKIIGVTLQDLRKVSLTELTILVSSATFTGLFLSVIMTVFLTRFILDEFPVFDWTYSLTATGLMLVIAIATGFVSIMRLTKKTSAKI